MGENIAPVPFFVGRVNPLPSLGIKDSDFSRNVIYVRLGTGGDEPLPYTMTKNFYFWA